MYSSFSQRSQRHDIYTYSKNTKKAIREALIYTIWTTTQYRTNIFRILHATTFNTTHKQPPYKHNNKNKQTTETPSYITQLHTNKLFDIMYKASGDGLLEAKELEKYIRKKV